MLTTRINGIQKFLSVARRRPGLRQAHLRQLQASSWRQFSTEDNKHNQEDVLVKLRKWQGEARTHANNQIENLATAAQQNLAVLGSKLNEMTGYKLVEELKRQVVEQGEPSVPLVFRNLTPVQRNE